MNIVIEYSGRLAMLLVEHPFWTVILGGTFCFLTFVWIMNRVLKAVTQ